jgi:nucleoside-diphosphate-sugar epimerase
MKVLVTGHAGYIGAVMVPILRSRGHDVVGLDSELFSGCDLAPYRPGAPSLRCDLRDVREEQLRGFDAVVHLAAISNDPLGEFNPECTFEINHLASVRLAELARRAGVRRFLYSSSCSVYGAASPDAILDETAGFRPITPYAESKVRVEADVSALASDSFSPSYLRNATVYGVSPRLRGDLVVNNLTGWAFTTGRVQLKSDGTPWRPLVHVEDLCHAFACVLAAPRETVHDEAFNVGRPGENYRIREVADLVCEALPDSRITFADGAGPDARCYRVDFAKLAARLPAFRPRWTVQRGIAQLVEAYRRAGLSREQLEGDRFVRIERILRLVHEGRLRPDLRWTAGADAAAPAETALGAGAP